MSGQPNLSSLTLDVSCDCVSPSPWEPGEEANPQLLQVAGSVGLSLNGLAKHTLQGMLGLASLTSCCMHCIHCSLPLVHFFMEVSEVIHFNCVSVDCSLLTHTESQEWGRKCSLPLPFSVLRSVSLFSLWALILLSDIFLGPRIHLLPSFHFQVVMFE